MNSVCSHKLEASTSSQVSNPKSVQRDIEITVDNVHYTDCTSWLGIRLFRDIFFSVLESIRISTGVLKNS